ncbi:MAG: hypothetical protein P8177_05965 [Gemmatimonadota bacterium]
MRALWCVMLVLVGCAGADSSPVDVAERFHAGRAADDDAAVFALITPSDRAAMPMDSFPAGLPSGLTETLLGWSGVALDSATLADETGDTARVLLHTRAGPPDTVVLVATREPRGIPLLDLERVTWRVSLRVAERARLDSLAAAMRVDRLTHDEAVARAEAFGAAAEASPGLARSADVEAARTTLRRARVAAALGIDLRVAESFMGTRFIQGRVRNPTDGRIATLRLHVRDAGGEEQWVDLWNVAAGGTDVRELTHLRPGPVSVRLEEIRLY